MNTESFHRNAPRNTYAVHGSRYIRAVHTYGDVRGIQMAHTILLRCVACANFRCCAYPRPAPCRMHAIIIPCLTCITGRGLRFGYPGSHTEFCLLKYLNGKSIQPKRKIGKYVGVELNRNVARDSILSCQP